MFNRIFSKKGKTPSGSGKEQGSLLDLIDEGDRAADNIIDFPGYDNAPGSLLSDLNAMESQARRAEEAAYHERLVSERSAMAALAHAQQPYNHQPDTPPLDPVPQPQHRDLPDAHRQQEQLELLSRELKDIAELSRSRETVASAPVQDEPAKNGAAAMRSVSMPDWRAGLQSRQADFGFEAVVRTLFRGWWIILACGLIGACIAALYSLSLPNKYMSVAEILIEPRGVTVIENSVAPNGLNREATIAYAESQVRILTSSSVLDPVIEDLDLANDPEFNGNAPANSLFGFLGNVLRGETESAADRATAAKKYLYDNMFVTRINQTFTIQIGVATQEPTKSARIANAIARGYMNAESRAKSSAARSATEDLTGRLDELRAKVRQSEEQVESYKAENGLVDADGKLVSEVQLSRLNDQLAVAQAQVSDSRSRAEQAAQADLSDVLSGSLPTALVSPTVTQLRVQYSRAKSRLDRISTTLGPRHPERIGAEAELRSARQAIAGELSRIVESAQEDFQSARSRLADIRGQVNTLKASAVTDSAAKVKLRELVREVDANRRVYESFLLRSRETGEQENIRTDSARLISEATPPAEKEGPNRKLITIGGGVAGGILGSLLALIPFVLGAVGALLKNDQKRGYRETQAPAFDDDLYSSYEPVGHHQPVDGPSGPPHSVDTSSPGGEPHYHGAASHSVAASRSGMANGFEGEGVPTGPVTRAEMDELRRELQARNSHRQEEAAPSPMQAQPHTQPQVPPQAQPQMPLFPQPQPYVAYPQPQPVYTAMPVMQPIGYPMAPSMPYPAPGYAMWPQPQPQPYPQAMPEQQPIREKS